MKKESRHSVCVTGASGYIGKLLLKHLENTDIECIATARRPEFLKPSMPWVNFKYCDLLKKETLKGVFEGIDTLFYLVHALGETKEFVEKELQMARHVVEEATAAQVKHIIYLGGLVNERSGALSAHMKSRVKVGDILRQSGIRTTELRASIILGPGSLSFELIRALVNRLPLMIIPKWVRVKAEPIFIDHVIDYLYQVLRSNNTKSEIIEIGGGDQVSYLDLMKLYAEIKGLKRIFISIPFLTPYVSSLWLGLVTPIYASIGRKLIESIVHPSVTNSDASEKGYTVGPLTIKAAMQKCLEREERNLSISKWSDTLTSSGYDKDISNLNFRTRIINHYKIRFDLDQPDVFKAIECIGGKKGWYYGNILWKIRGFIDLCVGGVGLRRSRRHPTNIRVGDAIDWWRVEAYERGKRLRLFAEMKLPGRAWLEFELKKDQSAQTLIQTVIYDPVGLWGLAYWYILLPVHWFMFKGMLRNIKKEIKNI
ncbi:MAG: SDR family oxidoreductase [bacterium]